MEGVGEWGIWNDGLKKSEVLRAGSGISRDLRQVILLSLRAKRNEVESLNQPTFIVRPRCVTVVCLLNQSKFIVRGARLF